ncbi:unnamed protein product [Caenorhabditis angaria]|uniref:Uncharacterized protein n=1 Tax=Caenorhabditis angaria TaxID=860376 RepID=A0A9P1NA96_9PELO|nr:unnamed protein product [Caenorhabditis angaria]
MVSFLAPLFFVALISTLMVDAEIIDGNLMVDNNLPVYQYVYYPTISHFNKFKRNIGRQCFIGMTYCMTPRQVERYRKFMETFEHYPQRSF